MGYCSRKNANGYDKHATADHVSNFLNDARSRNEWIKSDGPLTDKDKETARDTILFCKFSNNHGIYQIKNNIIDQDAQNKWFSNK